MYLPEGHPEVAAFVQSYAQSPSAQHDDDVDALTQGLTYLGAPQVMQRVMIKNCLFHSRRRIHDARCRAGKRERKSSV